MPFPLSAQGTVTVEPLSPADIQRVMDRVDKALREAKASDISRTAQQLRFRVGFFRFVPSWNQLLFISSGEIAFSRDADKAVIHYHLFFVKQLIVISVGVVLMFGILPIFLYGIRYSDLGFLPIILPIAWLWIFGGNYALTAFRFPRFLRAAARRW
jgi:hypothetical protein